MMSLNAFSGHKYPNDPKNTSKLENNSIVSNKNTIAFETEEYSEKRIKTKETKSIQQRDSSSANYNSSCKFNFLFYFIYKIKYDEDDRQNETGLNFEVID